MTGTHRAWVPKPMTHHTCDVFCCVIDNFGDAGIAWRLVQCLRAENGWKMRLIIDDVSVLSALVPELDAACSEQQFCDVQIVAWPETGALEPADIVIELFSCRLPEAYEAAIDAARRSTAHRPVVLAVDYLTAEHYAETSNGLQSPHPRYGYPKTFLFPGFSDLTCGFLREADLWERLQHDQLPEQRRALLAQFGANPEAPLTLFFFTYPQMPLEAFASALAQDRRPIQILAAPGQASAQLRAFLARIPRAEHVKIVDMPMVPQSRFDAVLSACDACLVRGEDSTLRAQLAARALIWTLYPQSEDTHLVKLRAFAQLYTQHMTQEDGQVWMQLNLWLNNGQADPLAWSRWRDRLPQMQQAAQSWQKFLFSVSSQSQRITQVVEKQLK